MDTCALISADALLHISQDGAFLTLPFDWMSACAYTATQGTDYTQHIRDSHVVGVAFITWTCTVPWSQLGAVSVSEAECKVIC
jgi:hypothetical protein